MLKFEGYLSHKAEVTHIMNNSNLKTIPDLNRSNGNTKQVKILKKNLRYFFAISLATIIMLLIYLEMTIPVSIMSEHQQLADAYRRQAASYEQDWINYSKQASLGTNSSLYPSGPKLRPDIWRFKAALAFEAAKHFRKLTILEEGASRRDQ